MPPTISAGGIGLAPNAAVVGPRGGEEGAIHKTDVGTTHVARAQNVDGPCKAPRRSENSGLGWARGIDRGPRHPGIAGSPEMPRLLPLEV